MARFLLLFCALAIGAIATLIYVDASRFDSNVANATQNDELMAMAVPAETVPADAAAPAQDASVAATTSATPTAKKATAKQIARWIEETEDDDPAIRSAAIDALSNVPKAKAMPALLNVMRAGNDGDRQLAMDSMHTLALQQGDDNDEIRTALRLVIYDGEEEAMISNAQIALEDIEYDIAPAPPIEKPHAKARQR